ncbi:hypothetical protein HDU98_002522 [Podochytrium sp. JEL0797]|nr:hypothetical protein HDU98_002522 [Podochytrium sp. JEL0797]
MFNNDTGKEQPHIFHNIKSHLVVPNTNGYTLLADCRTVAARPTGKWKLRLISEPTHIYPPDKPPTEMSTKPITQDFEESYVQNKHNVLFRYVMKVKDAPENVASFQLTFSLPQVMIKLQVFDNDVEIASVSGKGIVSLHTVSLLQVIEEATVQPSTAAVSSGGKGDKKDKEKEAVEKKEKEEKERIAKEIATVAAATLAVPIIKHRYVIQATVQQLDLIKPNSPNLLVSQDANRPSSRGSVKTPSSATPNKAKKKQSAGTGGATAGSATSSEPPTSAGPDLFWKLRIISTDTASLTVVKDTEKEDRYKMIKDTWEASQPGRSAKAREARESYLKLVESGAIKPVVALLTPFLEDAPPVVQIGKPKKVVVTANGGDIVYKPWVLLKENGHGGKRLDSLDKTPLVFGTNGERVVYEPARVVTAASSSNESQGMTRAASFSEDVNVDANASLAFLSSKPGTGSDKESGGTSIRASVVRGVSPIPESPIIATSFPPFPEALKSPLRQSALPEIQEPEDEMNDSAEPVDEPPSVSPKPRISFLSPTTAEPKSREEDPEIENGHCPATIQDLQSYLKGTSTYTRRNTLFSIGSRLSASNLINAFDFKFPTVVLPGGFAKPIDASRRLSAIPNVMERRNSKIGTTIGGNGGSRRGSYRGGAPKEMSEVGSNRSISVSIASIAEIVPEVDDIEEDKAFFAAAARRKSSFFNAIWKPPPPNRPLGRVLNDLDKEERFQKRQEMLQQHLEFHEEVLKMRGTDREMRLRVKQYIAEKLDEIVIDIDAEKSEDQMRREMYRARVAKEYEDASKLKLQQEMQRAAELAALEGAAAEEQAKDVAASKKKGGKK